MEPHAAIAVWSGDQLTLYTTTQTIANIQAGVANTLRMPLQNVRVISPFIGGGFGSKLIVHPEAVLAAFAARALNRPVKVALTRQQMFANAGHRPTMIQQVRLGAERDGRLTAIGHDVTSSTSRFDEFAEQSAVPTRALYAGANRRTSHRLVRLDINRGEWMRAPGEASGLLALECAMDELAEKLALDPIELRIRNEPERDPELNVPFSSRNLIPCMREGARRFGWQERPAKPGSRRDGRKLIGYGMAAAIRANYIGPGSARVSIDAKGRGHGASRYDGYRHRHLYDPDASRGRASGRADLIREGRTRRQPLAEDVGLRRLLGSHELRHRRPQCLPCAARADRDSGDLA